MRKKNEIERGTVWRIYVYGDTENALFAKGGNSLGQLRLDANDTAQKIVVRFYSSRPPLRVREANTQSTLARVIFISVIAAPPSIHGLIEETFFTAPPEGELKEFNLSQNEERRFKLPRSSLFIDRLYQRFSFFTTNR